MNRRQEIVMFLAVVALVATWLFPPWIEGIYEGSREDRFPPTPRFQNVGYAFLFTWGLQGGVLGNDSHTIDWDRLVLADLSIVAVGTSVLYRPAFQTLKMSE